MRHHIVAFTACLLASFFIPKGLYAGSSLKINGSTTVNPIVVEAAERLEESKNWKIVVDTQGGSSGGVAQLAEGLVDIGMISRPLADHDRGKFPKFSFAAHIIGYDGVALVVPQKLAQRGVKALTKDQIKKIYEGTITNWRDCGGPDQRIVFYNKEPGRGTWETFANYLYGSAEKAPKVFHLEVGSNQEGLTKVTQTNGGITQLSAAWAKGEVYPLAILEGNKVIEPNSSNIGSGVYPMSRPLVLVTAAKPTEDVQKFVGYILSPEGQSIVAKHGYLPINAR